MLLFTQTIKNVKAAAGGYGLALLMVFIASTVLVGVSFQLVSTPASIAYLGTSSQDNLAAKELAMVGLDETETDIRTKLQAGTSITTSYRYPASGTNQVNIPSDPTNLASSGVQVGTYYATVTQARGNTYLIKVVATVGGATVEYSRLMQASKVTTTTNYDCSVVENQVLAGNVASIADADLIAYAQNNCMVKTASVNVTAPTVSDGATDGCSNGGGTSWGGSGTISVATYNTYCISRFYGTYTNVYLRSVTSTTQQVTIMSDPTSGSRTIHIPGAVSNFITIIAEGDSGIATENHTFLFNAAGATSSFMVAGGHGNDLISFNGNSLADIYTNQGTDTVIVNGVWGTASDGNTLELGYTGVSSTNYLYIDTIQANASNGNAISGVGTGPNYIYFNKINGGGSINISGGSGNDIISCGVGFNGVTPACNATQVAASNGATYLEGRAGNDIISLDAVLSAGLAMYGQGGYNIIYSKGSSASSAIYLSSGPPGLVISGGNRTGGLISGSSTAGSVLLKKSGTTDGGTISGFSRTLTY